MSNKKSTSSQNSTNERVDVSEFIVCPVVWLLWVHLLKENEVKQEWIKNALYFSPIILHTPAALLKPVCNIVPHVVGLKWIKQEVGGFNELGCFLVFSEFAEKATQKKKLKILSLKILKYL